MGDEEQGTTAWLRGNELFRSLSPEDLSEMAAECRLYPTKKGNTVFLPGDPGNALFIVVKGSIDILRSDEAEGNGIIAQLVAGDSFGELELLSSTSHNMTALASEDSILLRFPRKGRSFETVLRNHPAVSARFLFTSLAVIAGRIRGANNLLKENSPWVQEIRRQVHGDKLTGLFNKTCLEETIPASLHGAPVAILMVKPDNFKEINDRFGHDAGDTVLKLMAAELNKHVGDEGTVYRYMGNELSVLLSGKGRDAASETARGIRCMLNSLDLGSITAGASLALSVSIGIAVYPEHAANGLDLISRAHELPLIGRARGGNLILFPEDQ